MRSSRAIPGIGGLHTQSLKTQRRGAFTPDVLPALFCERELREGVSARWGGEVWPTPCGNPSLGGYWSYAEESPCEGRGRVAWGEVER